MQPTPEQSAIVDLACSSSESILINALAGSAKTTTLQMICEAMPIQPILSLAFNKRIAEEMTRRLPGHVKCATLNSIGHRVWGTALGKRLTLEKSKTYGLLKGAIDELPKPNRRAASENFSELLRAIGAAKANGYVPEGKFDTAKRLTGRSDFYASLDDDIDGALVDSVLTASIVAAYAGTIDFDDQIYMPTLFGGTFPKFPLVLVDEAQDLSPLNHAMLERLVTQRLIAVGDPFQSIYGFRGADSYSMSHLRDRFKMTERTLSVSFRCPSAIVHRARSRAPTMQSFIQGGSVNSWSQWESDQIPDGAAIICRNNAPLFKMGMELLKRGRPMKIVGSDIGPGLLRTLRALGPEAINQKETLNAIDRWEAERLAKAKGKAAAKDRADCLRVFAEYGKSLSDIITYAEHILRSDGPIQLLSGHKSKGLEWNTVIHLDPWRIPSPYAESPEEIEQELNIDYVITTRAREALVLADLENFR